MVIWHERRILDMAGWWACHDDYLYWGKTLPSLLWVMITEWRHDKHLVG